MRWNSRKWKWKEDESLRITARYGVDVSAKWETACADDGWGPNSSGNIQYTLLANMPAENLTMYEKMQVQVKDYLLCGRVRWRTNNVQDI